MKRILWLLGLMSLFSSAHAAPNLGKALEGTSWRWDSHKLAGVTPESKIKIPITLSFSGRIASWTAGCNGAGGTYLLKSFLLSVPKSIGTLKACAGGKSDVETALGAFMRHGVFVKLESKNGSPSKLILNSATTSGVLTLVPAREKR